MVRRAAQENPALACATWVMSSMTGAVDSYSLWGNAYRATYEASEELDDLQSKTSRKRARRRATDREQILAFLEWMFDRGLHSPWCPECAWDGNGGWDLEMHISRALPAADMPEILACLLAPCPDHGDCEFEVRDECWYWHAGAWSSDPPPDPEDVDNADRGS